MHRLLMHRLTCLLVACIALGACTKDGQLAGDDPTRNNEGPGEGRPMDSNPSMRERDPEPNPAKERAYATDDATEQTTTAPPNPD